MEFLINIANILYICSYFVQDILRLRFFTIIAATCLVAYFYLQPAPMMTIVYWNLFFILLNIMQIGRTLLQRRLGYDPLRLVQVRAKMRYRKSPFGRKRCRTTIGVAE